MTELIILVIDTIISVTKNIESVIDKEMELWHAAFHNRNRIIFAGVYRMFAEKLEPDGL